MEKWISGKANIEQKDFRGNTPLINAITYGNLSDRIEIE